MPTRRGLLGVLNPTSSTTRGGSVSVMPLGNHAHLRGISITSPPPSSMPCCSTRGDHHSSRSWALRRCSGRGPMNCTTPRRSTVASHNLRKARLQVCLTTTCGPS
jgi:hypothetical protein